MHRPPHVAKTVELPSGKLLEVVFPAGASAMPILVVAGVPTARDGELHICCACRSNLVEPREWEASGAGAWRVALRCPNCDHCREGVFTQDAVDRFDERLDEATGQMVRELKQLERANFETEIESFTSALREDVILPEDF